jgi:dTMP kinase
MFITFEGLDCSGKTTQATRFTERLRAANGSEVVFLREPGGTAISERVRTILLDRKHGEMDPLTELMLFSASRAQLVREVIRPALQRGAHVVCDRYYDSTTAYQGYGRGMSLDAIRAVNNIATGDLVPDLTVLVDITPEEIERRRAAAGIPPDRMESSGRVFYMRVREGYRTMAAAEHRFLCIDGMRSMEEISEDIWNNFAGIQQRTL